MGNTIVRLPQNFHPRNEELDNILSWERIAATVDPNVIAAPNGEIVADEIEETAVASVHGIRSTVMNIPSTAIVYTISVYARPNERNWICLLPDTGTIGSYFDVLNGAIGNAIGAILDAQIRPAGPNWYRCWVVANWTALARRAYYYLAQANGTLNYLGTVGNGAYFWRPQMNEGWGPDDTFLTREVPRTGRH